MATSRMGNTRSSIIEKDLTKHTYINGIQNLSMIGINLEQGWMLCCPKRISSFLCHAQATHLAGASIGRARSLVPGLHVGDEVDHAVAVSHLIVVPGGRRRVKEIAIW